MFKGTCTSCKYSATVCSPVCLCLTCSDKELLYFLDMRFLIVSFTDFTFLPSEIRDVVGDLTTSLYIASCSLFCFEKRRVKSEDEQRVTGTNRWRLNGRKQKGNAGRNHKNKEVNRYGDLAEEADFGLCSPPQPLLIGQAAGHLRWPLSPR